MKEVQNKNHTDEAKRLNEELDQNLKDLQPESKEAFQGFEVKEEKNEKKKKVKKKPPPILAQIQALPKSCSSVPVSSRLRSMTSGYRPARKSAVRSML